VRLRADGLEAHLAAKLAPVYAVHGDEPLLALEAADQVRAAARKRGYAEREVLEVGRGFDWSEFRHATASQSLFGGAKIVELRLPSGKPAQAAAEAIVRYCERPGADMLLLLAMPRPEGAGWWKSDWFMALDGAGVVVEIEPVARAQLPAWIAKRLARQKQRAAPEVLEFLADRVEGNLLAAHQEVQKLALLAPETIDLETAEQAVATVARYDPHVALEALLTQNRARYVRVIEGLEAEGEAAPFVLFTLSSALFVMHGIARGGAPEALYQQHRFFNKKLRPLVATAARRVSAAALADALAHAAAIDRAIKGVASADPWEEIVKLGLKLADGSKA
jgi:DNA polymerase-3 subunit delta